MPLTFLAKGYLEDADDDLADAFVEWERCGNSFTPWEVANAVERIFEEDNLAKSLADFRVLMTTDHQSLADACRQALVPRIMALVQRHKHLDVQLEAIQTLLSLANSSRNVLHDVCAYSRVFVDLLSCTSANLREYAMHIMCSISPNQQLTQCGAPNALLRIACSAQNARELEIALQMLSEVLKWDNRWDLSPTATIAIFLQSRNPTVVRYAAKIVVSIMSRTFKTIDNALQAGVLPPTVELLRRTPTQDTLFSDALEIVHTISRGSEQHLQVLIDHDLLRDLRSALKSFVASLIACETLAKICAGSQDQVQQVIEAGIFEDLVGILHSNGNFLAKLEAVRAISNATIHASSKQMQLFVDMGCVQELAQCVIGPNFITNVASPALHALHALHKFLKFGATQSGSGNGQQNAIARMVKEASGGHFEEWRKRTANKRVHDLVVGVMELCGFEGMQ